MVWVAAAGPATNIILALISAAALIEGGAEHRQLHLLTLVGRRLEKAADSLSRCAFILRDHLLGEVMKA